MKVLVIDDNLDITTLMQKVLSSKGFEVNVCNDGKKGLELIQKNISDAILLDIAIPNFSGIDVIDSLKDDEIKNQNIILFTASSITDEEIRTLIKKGVKGCLRKPVKIQEVFKILNQFKK